MSKSKANTSTNQAQEPAVNEIDKVTEAYIAEIRERGLTHVLEWAGQWYARAARAEIEDMLKNYLDAKTNIDEKEELFLLDRLMSNATSADNFSTSAGHNLMRLARVAALANAVNDAHRSTPASRMGRHLRSKAVWAEDDAAQASSGAAKADVPSQS